MVLLLVHAFVSALSTDQQQATLLPLITRLESCLQVVWALTSTVSLVACIKRAAACGAFLPDVANFALSRWCAATTYQPDGRGCRADSGTVSTEPVRSHSSWCRFQGCHPHEGKGITPLPQCTQAAALHTASPQPTIPLCMVISAVCCSCIRIHVLDHFDSQWIGP